MKEACGIPVVKLEDEAKIKCKEDLQIREGEGTLVPSQVYVLQRKEALKITATPSNAIA